MNCSFAPKLIDWKSCRVIIVDIINQRHACKREKKNIKDLGDYRYVEYGLNGLIR